MYKINLLPPELQRDISIDIKKLVKRLSVSLVVMSVLAGYGTFLYSYISTKKEISQTEKYLNELQVTVKIVEDLKKQRQGNEHTIQIFTEMIDKRLTWSYVLDDFSRNLPVDVWLERIDLSYIDPQAAAGAAGQTKGQPNPQSQPQQAQAQGQAKAQAGAGATPGGQAPPAGQKGQPQAVSPPVPNTMTIKGYSHTVPSIGVFINNLNKMPYFTRITLNELAEDDKSLAFKFKLTAAVKEVGR
ncbi:MAG: Fimbrial assembly protein (PilN) [Pelotomaculum sp. PtaB.Bin104]|nr:MAG: Fimbrial assembly protein (PilN) [Pelotomaculum sp. PtaB.Bin104]